MLFGKNYKKKVLQPGLFAHHRKNRLISMPIDIAGTVVMAPSPGMSSFPSQTLQADGGMEESATLTKF